MITERMDICERCQVKAPERLFTFGIGVRGGGASWCAACRPQPGLAGESKRQEIIAIRRLRLSRPEGTR